MSTTEIAFSTCWMRRIIIRGFIRDRSKSELKENIEFRFALLKAIEVFGEAASRVSHETREKLPEVPWSKLVGARNRLVHGYFDVDLEIVWQTASTSIPELVAKLESALDSNGSDADADDNPQ